MWLKSIASYFLEFQCLVCGNPSSFQVCTNCIDTISILPNQIHFNSDHLYFQNVYAFGIFEGVLRELLHLYKFDHYTDLSRFFSQLLQEKFGVEIAQYDLFASTPLHRKKFKKRGFDQTELILEHLVPEEKMFRGVIRTRNTEQQSKQRSKVARGDNLRGAFELLPNTIKGIKGKRILLFDDVLTTGATLNALALPFFLGDAAAIDVMVLGLS